MSEGLKGDASHVQAHHSKWKVLLVIHRHSIDVTSQWNEVWCVAEIQQLQETQHSHSTQVCPRVCALQQVQPTTVTQQPHSQKLTLQEGSAT